jgi:hypothetical protein
MVNWESKADRDRRPPNKGRGPRSELSAKLVPFWGKNPTKEAAPAPAPAPRGSPIAKKLARYLSPWTTLIIPQIAIKVSPPYLCLLTLYHSFTASFLFGRVQFIARPRPDTATSHGRSLVPRVGSPSYWVPDLIVPSSGYNLEPAFQPRHIRLVHRTRGPTRIFPKSPLIASSPKRTVFNRLPACTLPLALPHP